MKTDQLIDMLARGVEPAERPKWARRMAMTLIAGLLIAGVAVALTIGLMELTARARAMQEFSFQVFEAFTAATVIYIIVNIVVVVFMRWFEKRMAVPGFIGSSTQMPQAGH